MPEDFTERLARAVECSKVEFQNRPIPVFVLHEPPMQRGFRRITKYPKLAHGKVLYERYLPNYLSADLLYFPYKRKTGEGLEKNIFELVGRTLLRKAESLLRKHSKRAQEGNHEAREQVELANRLRARLEAWLPRSGGSSLLIFDAEKPKQVYARLKPAKEGFGGMLDKFGGFSRVGESPGETLKRKIREEIVTSEPLTLLPFRGLIWGIAANDCNFVHYAVAPHKKIKPSVGEGYWLPIEAVKKYLAGDRKPLEEHLVSVGMLERQAKTVQFNPHYAQSLRAWFLKHRVPKPTKRG